VAPENMSEMVQPQDCFSRLTYLQDNVGGKNFPSQTVLGHVCVSCVVGRAAG
jgi:hypothetical protein